MYSVANRGVSFYPNPSLGFVDPATAMLAFQGFTTGFGLFKSRKRGKQKLAATAIVNEAEPLLQQNLAAWEQSPKTEEFKQLAVSNFHQVWNEVRAQCSNPELGPPGQWCIQDRDRGGKHDWFKRYLDPILQHQAEPQQQQQVTLPSGETVSVPATTAGGFGLGMEEIVLLVVGGIALMYGMKD